MGAASLRISGAVADNIIVPNKAAIEREPGLTLEVTAAGFEVAPVGAISIKFIVNTANRSNL